MGAEDARLAASQRLTIELVRRAEQAKADFAAAVAPLDVPVHLARALLMLEAPIPMHQLADQLACDRSYVTGLADGLEERGLVRRMPGSDRRIRLLALTPDGEALRSRVATAVGAQSRVLHRLTDEERAVLDRLLARLAGTSETEEPTGPARG